MKHKLSSGVEFFISVFDFSIPLLIEHQIISVRNCNINHILQDHMLQVVWFVRLFIQKENIGVWFKHLKDLKKSKEKKCIYIFLSLTSRLSQMEQNIDVLTTEVNEESYCNVCNVKRNYCIYLMYTFFRKPRS